MSDIVQSGDPVLRQIAVPVSESQFDSKELDDVIERMASALDAERDGVAIAAPQIGVSLRIFLVRHDRLEYLPDNAPIPEPEVGIFINPEFIKSSRRRDELDEGCLSVRNIYGKTLRHERATVRARRPDGTAFERGGGGLLAQVFQHEIDHLNGILFTDHAIDLVEITPEDRHARRQVSQDTSHES